MARRFASLLALVLSVLGCREPPRPDQPAPNPTLMVPPPLAPVPVAVEGCQYESVPLLTITLKQVLLDGSPVSEAELETALRQQRDLYELIGAAFSDQIILRVAVGVPERRVRALLARARAAGFVKVARLAAEPVRPQQGT